jgi:hypothetical protein
MMLYYSCFSTSLRKPHYTGPGTTEEMKFKGTHQSLEFSIFSFLQTNTTKISTGILLDKRKDAGTKANTTNTMQIFKVCHQNKG